MIKSVYSQFVEFVKPLFGDPRFNPYEPENYPHIRYALEQKFWECLEAAPPRVQPEANAILQTILAIRRGEGPSKFLIKNFPIDDTLPPTPIRPDYHGTNGKGYVSELAALAIMSLLDQTPISVPNFYGNSLIQQLSPRTGEERVAGGRGSAYAFTAHTDTSFFSKPPKWLSLVCLRNFEGAKTNVAFAEDVLIQFNPAELDVLQQSIFTFSSGSTIDAEQKSYTGPILTYDDTGHPRLRFNLAEQRTTSLTDEGNMLIRKLVETADFAKHPELDRGLILQQGNALFFDNGRCIHARTSFKPYENPPERRWMQRVLGSPTNRSKPHPADMKI